MIRIAGINENDFVNGKGVSVSLFLQGCPFHCKGCHNPETWNPDGGEIWDWNELINHILELITANGIQRNLCIHILCLIILLSYQLHIYFRLRKF